MKIGITVDLENEYAENGTVGKLIKEIVKDEVLKQLKKSPEFKEYVAKIGAKAVENLNSKGVL